jgi:hypothetical protein
MIKKLIFIMCFVPFPVFADELKALPSIYVDNEIRENLIKYPGIIEYNKWFRDKLKEIESVKC